MATSDSSPLFSISGIASGLDTATLITQLMAIERRPQVRVQQQQKVEEARQQALRDVNTRLLNLQTSIAGLRDAGTWADQQAVSSSDPTRISAIRTGGAAPGGYQLEVSRLARAQQLTQTTGAGAASADGTLTIKLGTGGSVDVTVAAGDSLQTVADKINGSSGMEVYATVVNGKMVLSGKQTGAASTISVGGSAAADFGFAETQAAQDAAYTIDGVAHTSGSNLVTDGMAGVAMTLKGVTSTPVTVTVGAPGPDAATVTAKVQAFVDQYNSTVEFIRSKLNEKTVPNASTDAERSKGALSNDPQLAQLLANLRGAIAEQVTGRPGDASLLSQVGVSTGASTGTISKDAVAGKLTLDTAKLGSMLANRFADTKALVTNPTGVYATEGIGQRLDGLVSGWVRTDGIIDGRIDAEQSTIDALKARSAEMDTRLAQREKSLRARFTAMETALKAAQSQGDYLSGQLAALTGSS